ncbi:MAG: hypothetical protein Q8R51_01465 [Azonexus sp.]|nr:hypothetical protein [Azonexus sp.]
MPVVKAIQECFYPLDHLFGLGPLELNISGCANACGNRQSDRPGVSAIGAFFILDEALGVRVVLGIIVVSIGALLGAAPSPGAMALLKRVRT